jgi:rare lipoprotein A (peptidoglycan hydrolase)
MKLKLLVSLTLTVVCATAAILGGRAATTPQATTYSDQLIRVQEVHPAKVVKIPPRVVRRAPRRPRVVARATRSYRRLAPPVYHFSGAVHYGRASWYTGGYGACGRALTGYYAASRTLPCGSHVLVSYGGHSVVVTILDRGPQSTLRDLDLSRSAFAALASTSKGVIWVHWRVQ